MNCCSKQVLLFTYQRSVSALKICFPFYVYFSLLFSRFRKYMSGCGHSLIPETIVQKLLDKKISRLKNITEHISLYKIVFLYFLSFIDLWKMNFFLIRLKEIMTLFKFDWIAFTITDQKKKFLLFKNIFFC